MEPVPAIDWPFAARTGRALVHPGPELTAQAIADVVAELRDAAARATGHVAEVTELARPEPAQMVLVVDRAGWVSSVCQSAKEMLSSVTAESADSALAVARSRALGAQAGGVFALVASRILGQFDPFHEPARLLLVAPNVVAIEHQLGVNPFDFRLWVCLHEETHRFQFGQARWLRGHLLGLFTELLDGDELHFGWPKGRPGSLRDLMTDPAQREAFDQVTAVMSLMEGHADVMMDRVGTRVVPSYESIRRSFEARRDQQGWGAWVRRLLGFDLKRDQYRDGAEFCRQVIEAAGVAALNRSFEAPGLLPTLQEIHDPQLWLHRI